MVVVMVAWKALTKVETMAERRARSLVAWMVVVWVGKLVGVKAAMMVVKMGVKMVVVKVCLSVETRVAQLVGLKVA